MRESRRRLDHSIEAGSSCGVDGPLAEAPLDGEALGLEGGEADGDAAGRQAGASRPGRRASAGRPPPGGRGAPAPPPARRWCRRRRRPRPARGRRRSPRRCATARAPSSPVSDATRPRRSRASSSSAHSGGHGLSRSVLSRSWSSSGVVGAGSISARTRSIASWVTRPSCSGATGRPRRSGTARDAPVDGLTVVEERVGRGVEDLVGEQRTARWSRRSGSAPRRPPPAATARRDRRSRAPR